MPLLLSLSPSALALLSWTWVRPTAGQASRSVRAPDTVALAVSSGLLGRSARRGTCLERAQGHIPLCLLLNEFRGALERPVP